LRNEEDEGELEGRDEVTLCLDKYTWKKESKLEFVDD